MVAADSEPIDRPVRRAGENTAHEEALTDIVSIPVPHREAGTEYGKLCLADEGKQGFRQHRLAVDPCPHQAVMDAEKSPAFRTAGWSGQDSCQHPAIADADIGPGHHREMPMIFVQELTVAQIDDIIEPPAEQGLSEPAGNAGEIEMGEDGRGDDDCVRVAFLAHTDQAIPGFVETRKLHDLKRHNVV